MRRKIHLSLQMKVGVFVVVGLLIIFALFGALGLSMLNQSVQRMVDERLVIAQLTASFLDTELEEQFEQLERAAPLAAVAQDNRLERYTLLSLLSHEEPFVDAIFFVDRAGRIRWSEPPGLTQLDPDFLKALGAGNLFGSVQRYTSGIRSMGSPTRPLAVMAASSADPDGTHAGALAAIIDPSLVTIRELVAGARKLGKTGHAELVDQDGLVVASSEQGRALKPGEHPDFYRPLLVGRTAAAAITEPIGDGDPSELGQRHAMAFAPLRVVPWGLSLGGSEAELFLESDRWRWQIVVLGGMALAAAGCLVWITTRSVARSVRALTLASQRMGEGDLATPVPDMGEGEVRTLAEALDEMRRHLQKALDAVAVETGRYQAIVCSMADAMFTTDVECRITAFNPSAEVLTGLRSEEALSRHCNEVVRSPEGPEQDQCSAKCIGRPVRALERRSVAKEIIQRRDGRAVSVVHARSAVGDSDGTLVGVVHVLRDISAEEELERLKDEFLSMVSHELRTPLGYIKGYSTTLLLPDGPADEETRQRCLRIIVEASDELEELVDNLLDMSKIGAGAFGIEPQAVQLRPLVRAAVERSRLHSNGHRLIVQVPSRLPLVSADERRIEQVFYNLLENALKYSPNGGRVVVAAQADDNEVLVRLSDEGIGVPPDEIAGLFEPFRRGRGARSRRIGGSGLGLAICKGIVEAHHGRIWAESPVPGRAPGARPGTVICLTLPIDARPGRRSNSHANRTAAVSAAQASHEVHAT